MIEKKAQPVTTTTPESQLSEMDRFIRDELYKKFYNEKVAAARQQVSNPQITFSRRSFTSTAVMVGLTGLLFHGPAKRAAAETTAITNTISADAETINNFDIAKQKPNQLDLSSVKLAALPANKIIETTLDQLRLSVGNIMLVTIMNSLGLKSGNAGMIKAIAPDLRESIDALLANDGLAKKVNMALLVKAPVFEELIYRSIPSALLDLSGRKDKAWTIGIISSVMFAAIHNFVQKPGAQPAESYLDKLKNYEFNTSVLPVPQLVLGLFYWHLAREYGALVPIPFHALANSQVAAMTSVSSFIVSKEANKLREQFRYQKMWEEYQGSKATTEATDS